MARNDVYLYTNATSPADAVVTAQANITAADFPELVLGDSPTFNFYFTDGTASWPALAGNAQYSVEWTLGTAGSDDSVILAHQTQATAITGGWSIVLPLNTGAILAQLNSARVSQAYPVVQLWQQVRVTDPTGYKTTYANIRTNLRLRTAPSGQVLPDDPLPSGYQTVTANASGLISAPSNFYVSTWFVGSRETPRSSDPGLSVNRTITGAGNAHGLSDQSEFSKAVGTAYAAFDARFLVSGSVNFDHFVSLQAAPTLSSTGTTTNLYGIYTLPGITAGTVTNSYGLYIANPAISGTGAITNSWGIYVAAPSGPTNNYAAAFMGKVGIGIAEPVFALDILGTNQRINLADTGSGYQMVKVGNSLGALYFGKENNTGNTIVTGSAAGSCLLVGDGNYPLVLGTNGTIRFTISGAGIFTFAGVPTSSAGLTTGQIWNDGGTLKIIS